MEYISNIITSDRISYQNEAIIRCAILLYILYIISTPKKEKIEKLPIIDYDK